MPVVRALAERALALDESWSKGAIHEMFISLDSLPEALGGSPAKAREHFTRAVDLQHGQSPGPYVALATGVALPAQDRAEFEKLLQSALAIDPEKDPSVRLVTLVQQRRARALRRSHRHHVHRNSARTSRHVRVKGELIRMSALKRFLVLASIVAAPALILAAPGEIKLATLVPANTSWHKALLDMGNTWNKDTAGRVTLTVYPGGIQGDESTVIKKMRPGIDTLQASFLTAAGLAELDESFNVFAMPFFFETDEEEMGVEKKLRRCSSRSCRPRGSIS